MEVTFEELIAKLSAEKLCPGGCGRTVVGPVKCDECYARDARRDAKQALDDVAQRVPGRFRSVRFDSPDFASRCGSQAMVLKNCPLQSITLRGKAGAGKTSAAAAMCNEVLRRGLTGDRAAFARALGLRWYSSHDLSAARTVHGSGRGEAPDVELAVGATVLVLDELGSERFPDTPSEVIFRRHDLGRQTVVTTWMSEPEVAQRYGGGIARRLWDDLVIKLEDRG
jgi:DNA replication protein DnaC